MRRPDLIDPALLRPGRLDVLLYVGVAEDSHSKLKVLQALTRKFDMEDGIDLGVIAEKCPPTFTGADMYALSSDAWMTALKRTVSQVCPYPAVCSVYCVPRCICPRHCVCGTVCQRTPLGCQLSVMVFVHAGTCGHACTGLSRLSPERLLLTSPDLLACKICQQLSNPAA